MKFLRSIIPQCTVIALVTLAVVLTSWLPVSAADTLFPTNLKTHYLPLATIPSSPADIYTSSVWLKSIELIPQSSSSPTCTIQDKAGSPNVVYNVIPLSPHVSYRDARSDTAPLFMSGGITWSCSDTTVKAQVIVMY